MKIQEIIDKIEEYHGDIPGYSENPRACDGVKYGNPNQECKGMLLTVAPTVDMIRKAIEIGANFIYVHEPAFYTHLDQQDYLVSSDVYQGKTKLLKDHNIVIYRDHDHIHHHSPDGIYTGIMMELGWQDYLVSTDPDKPKEFVIPETTVRELALFLKGKLHSNMVRVLGNLDGKVRKICLCGHLRDGDNDVQQAITRRVIAEDIDVLLPLESVDWTGASYMLDAGQLGLNKAMIQVGHVNFEELGVKYAMNWIGELTEHQVPMQFHRAGDIYRFL